MADKKEGNWFPEERDIKRGADTILKRGIKQGIGDQYLLWGEKLDGGTDIYGGSPRSCWGVQPKAYSVSFKIPKVEIHIPYQFPELYLGK